MKYIFIEKYQAEFSIKTICRVLQVARSGWYVWRLRSHRPGKRQQFRLIFDAAVRKAFTEAKQRYGAPRLADELPEYNLKTIAASLRRQGVRAKAVRKFSPVSYREHGLPVSYNLLISTYGRGLVVPGGAHRPVVACCNWLVDVTAYDGHSLRVMHCKWRSGGVNARKMSLFTRDRGDSTVHRIIRPY